MPGFTALRGAKGRVKSARRRAGRGGREAGNGARRGYHAPFGQKNLGDYGEEGR
jgi:hypothetical protein